MLGLPTTGDCTQISNFYSTNPGILRTDTLTAISAAIAAGTRTTGSISQNSCTEAEYLSFIAECRELGFTVTLGSGSFTLNWQ